MNDILEELEEMLESPSPFQDRWVRDNIIRACGEIRFLRNELNVAQTTILELKQKLRDMGPQYWGSASLR